ncbi:MAG: CARDB domain-containing protein [Bacteroidales bacterium]|nr:CARDB domain-containing protein [Bacteroidales bacterium]
MKSLLLFPAILLLSTVAVNFHKTVASPAIDDADYLCENAVSDHKIPIYPGSRIIKESSSDSNYNLVLETGDQPEKVALYYKKEMQNLGWPDGAVMSVKNSAALMLNDNGKQFALKAVFKNGKTRVDIVMIGDYNLTVISEATVHSDVLPTTIPGNPNVNINEREIQQSERVSHIEERELITPPEDNIPESDQTNPFLKPEFELTDIAYWPERTRIRAMVKNSGKPYEGNLEIRVNLSDPYSEYTLDRTVSVPVSLNVTDNEWLTLLTDFVWPEPIDHSTLNAVVAVDPENRIEENDEQNNHFHKILRVPCGIHIEALSNQHLVKGQGEDFAIYGQFGSQRSGKYVCAETDYSQLNLPGVPEDTRTNLWVKSWKPSAVIVDVSGLGTGTYEIKFYCSDPETTEAYSSNAKVLQIVRKRIKIQLSSGPFNASDMAAAMAEGYEDWFRDTSTNLEEMWVEEGSPGAIVNCLFTKKPYKVVLEIYSQDFRIAYREIMEFQETEEGHALSEAFSELGPGFYILKCKQIMDIRHPDEVRHEHSVMFRLE